MLFGGATLAIVFAYMLVTQLVLGTPVGERSAPDMVLALLGSLMLVLGAGLLFLALRGKLVTEVRESLLFVQHYPISRAREIAYPSISECYMRTYRPIREYGGWGVRFGFSGRGWAYNVSGNRGVQLVFTNEKPLLIGSQRADELAQSIMAAREVASKV